MSIGPEFDSVLQAARLGAEWAWAALYRDLSPSVLRYLWAHGAQEPEDLLGETFVQVVRKLSTFEGGEAQFRAWVFTIARNALHMQWRAAGRRPVEYLPAELLCAIHGESDTEEEALRTLAHQRATAMLAGLTADQRDVVFLRIIAGFTIEEVAKVLGKPAGAVKSLQARGLAAIRREFSGEAVS